MKQIDAAKTWSLNYRLLMAVITSVAGDLTALGLDGKDLFVLAAIDEHPYPAQLASELCMPRPTVTFTLKRMEAAGFVRREIDSADLRRHRLSITALGRRTMARGLARLSSAYERRLARLTRIEQQQLATLLEKMS